MTKILKKALLILAILWMGFTSLYFFRDRFLKKVEQSKKELTHQWKHPSQYQSNLSVAFYERFFTDAPGSFLSYLNLRNKLLFSSVGLVAPDPSFKSKFKSLYDEWPLWLKGFCEKHIVAIYFADEHWSSATTFALSNNQFILIFNAKLLDLNGNDWARLREETVLNLNDNQAIEMVIQEENNYENLGAFMCVLLHELGHCVSIQQGIVPGHENTFQQNASVPFFGETHHLTNIQLVPKLVADERYKTPPYYMEKLYSWEDYKDIIHLLKSSAFPTVYSLTSYEEYFAEIFFLYLHYYHFQQPFYHLLKENNQVVLSLENHITDASYEMQREFMKQLIEKLENEYQ